MWFLSSATIEFKLEKKCGLIYSNKDEIVSLIDGHFRRIASGQTF